MSMQLANAVSATVPRPARIEVFGPAGVGKTTGAVNGSPSPFLAAVEDGAIGINCPMLRPETWEQCRELLDNLEREPHQFQTLVWDSATATERLVNEYVMRTNNAKSLADVGYGKGYQQVGDLFTEFFGRLERIRAARGMHIIVIGHSAIRTFTDPSGKSWERYVPDLEQKRVLPQFLQWPDALLFADFQKAVGSKRDGMKEIKYGMTTGERILYTQHSAAYEAKNRYNLPPQMPLNIAEVFRLIGEFYGVKAPE